MHLYHEYKRSLIIFSFSDEPEAERSKGTSDDSVCKIHNTEEIPEKSVIEEEDEEDNNVKVDNRDGFVFSGARVDISTESEVLSKD